VVHSPATRGKGIKCLEAVVVPAPVRRAIT
jgi:hypothetical protein